MATNASFSPAAVLAPVANANSQRAKTLVDETLKTLAVILGIGLAVALLAATNGLDMSLGFF